jgi:hypothetical protein
LSHFNHHNDGRLKKFGWPSFVATKKIQSPSDTPTPSNGKQKFLVIEEGKHGMNFFSPK